MPRGFPNNTYSGEFKQHAVEFMRVNKLSSRDAAKKLGIGKSMINRWERIYLMEGTEALNNKRRSKVSKISDSNIDSPPKMSKQVEEDLISENRRLTMENEYLKKLNALIQKREESARKTKR